VNRVSRGVDVARVHVVTLVEIAGADQTPFTEGGDDIADLITEFANRPTVSR
jgi:hypothetical protein